MIRPVYFLLIFLLPMQLAWGRTPYVPTSTDEIIETLPPGVKPSKLQELSGWMERLTQAPDNERLAVEIAGAYVRLAQQRDDPYYYGRAQKALAYWDKIEAPPFEVLVLRADIAQFSHSFDAAVRDLNAALKVRPAAGQVWFNLAIIELVRGNFEEARRACNGIALSGASIASRVCLAQVDSVNGQSSRALKVFEDFLGDEKITDKALLVWAMTGYGELLQRLGDLKESRKVFREARRLAPDDNYLFNAYCDLLLQMKLHKEVVKLTTNNVKNDNVLLRRALGLQGINFTEMGMALEPLEAAFLAARERGTPVHQREEAIFYLELKKDPAKSLASSIENFKNQREPIDALVYLKAAVASENTEHLAIIKKFYKDSKLEDMRAEELLGQ